MLLMLVPVVVVASCCCSGSSQLLVSRTVILTVILFLGLAITAGNYPTGVFTSNKWQGKDVWYYGTYPVLGGNASKWNENCACSCSCPAPALLHVV